MKKTSEVKIVNESTSTKSKKHLNSKPFNQNRNSELSKSIRKELNASLALSDNNLISSPTINDKFKSIIESSYDWIWEINKWHQFTYTNSAIKHCLGYSPRALERKYIYDYMNKKDFFWVSERLIKEINHDVIQFENEFLHRDGRTLLFETNCVPIINEVGNTIGFQGISREISNRNKLEMDNKKTIDELTLSNELKGVVLDIIAHDLKNPAYVIMATSEMACDDNSEDERFQLIKNSSEKLVKVLDDAIEFSHVVNRTNIKKENIVLKKIINELLTELEISAPHNKLKVELNFSSSFSIWASLIINEVIKNYLSNAIQYCQGQKKIIIDGFQNSNYTIVKVKDTGITIPLSDRKAIFERGIQLSNNNKTGRGIGLFIAKIICEAHNGKAWVEPNIPTGNSFCMKIPLKPKDV